MDIYRDVRVRVISRNTGRQPSPGRNMRRRGLKPGPTRVWVTGVARFDSEVEPPDHLLLAHLQEVENMDTGDTAWVLARAALVLLMTPGLALFYGGMVRAKSVLNMMMMSFGALALDQRPVGALRLLDGVRQRRRRRPGRQPVRVLRAQGPDRDRGRRQGLRRHPPGLHDPVDGVRRLPGRVRHHHRRADLRRDRRPGPLRPLDGLRRHLGDGRLLPGRALGVRLRRRPVRERRLDRQQACSRSTSPVARRCTSTPVPRASRSPSCSASGSASEARPDAAAQPDRW